jgi:tetratricopeptide (TPR) repeat protein
MNENANSRCPRWQSRPGLRFFLVGILLSLAFQPSMAGEPSSVDVQQLIEQLGSDSYATRVRARARLQHLGLEAFDELHAAQNHSDIEVEMASRYLVSSLMVSWAKETDSEPVQGALHEYGSQSEIERGSRIVRLAQMDPQESLDALVRLTRFETSPQLSEKAALELMKQAMVADPDVRKRMSEKIIAGLGDADRPPTDWLRVYAKDLLAGKYSADAWDALIDFQREKIDTESAHPATRQSVLELVQICASRSADLGQRDEAIRLATEHLDLIQPTSSKLIDAATWAVDHDLHPVVLSLRKQFTRMFDGKPILLYAAAEALQAQGDVAGAESMALEALKKEPMPTKEQAEKMSDGMRQDIAQGHLDMAKQLEKRGQFKWSLREYNEILDSVDLASWESAIVRLSASRTLADLQRHQDVVDMLEPFVDRLDKDEKLRMSLQHRGLNLKLIRSELEFHSAQALAEAGKMEEARRKLSLAYLKSNRNIDILIRMYRTQGDDQWRQEVQRHLKIVTLASEKDIQAMRGRVRSGGAAAESDLSELLNNYAWLIANTEGDFQKALRYSLESLTIRIDGAKYDTCARCYFAVGDIENAIETQKKAIKLLPHSPPLERQLEEFEQALAKRNSQEPVPQ